MAVAVVVENNNDAGLAADIGGQALAAAYAQHMNAVPSRTNAENAAVYLGERPPSELLQKMQQCHKCKVAGAIGSH